MNHEDKNSNLAGRTDGAENLEPDMREALGDFKLSVDAWSEAMISRPREMKVSARTNWSALMKWALGCVVFAGTVSTGLYQNHRQAESAKVEAARIAEQQRVTEAASPAKLNEEDLMAEVDSDVARQVPNALQPLATLMNDDEATGN